MEDWSSGGRLDGDWLRLPCACANLRRLTRLATRIYDEQLRPAGMEIGQFGLTATIARLGQVTQGQLVRALAMDQTSLTRTLAVLQTRGWIVRRVGTDRRRRVFAVTKAGRAQIDRARPYWRRAQRRLRAAIGGEHVDSLDAIVNAAALALHADVSAARRGGTGLPSSRARK